MINRHLLAAMCAIDNLGMEIDKSRVANNKNTNDAGYIAVEMCQAIIEDEDMENTISNEANHWYKIIQKLSDEDLRSPKLGYDDLIEMIETANG